MATRAGGRIEWLFEQAPKLTGTQFVVLAYQLLRCVDRDGRHWRSSRTIADALNMPERTVRQAQLELEQLGMIERLKRRSKTGGQSRSTIVLVLSPGVHRYHPDVG